MPKGESREGEHVVYTNHEIPRGAPSPSGPSAVPVLLSYWPGKASPRDEAMAYAVLAMQRPDLRRRALQMLETAASRTEDDIPLFAQLAQFHDAIRRTSDARSLYERVLRLDPDHATAAANLAVHWIEAGRTAEAIELWERVVSRNPSMTGAAMNLAVAYLRSGQKEQGLETLRRLLRFQPDHEAARDLLRQAAP